MRGDVCFFCDRFDKAFGGLPAPWRRALIALQSVGGGNAKSFAAAQRTFDRLDRLRLRMLEDEADQMPLNRCLTLYRRAHAAADKNLQDIYDQIALRARVELAKLGC